MARAGEELGGGGGGGGEKKRKREKEKKRKREKEGKLTYNVASQCKYINDVVPYLDSEPAIARYAWFAHDMAYTGEVALVGADGYLTELGRCYDEA